MTKIIKKSYTQMIQKIVKSKMCKCLGDCLKFVGDRFLMHSFSPF